MAGRQQNAGWLLAIRTKCGVPAEIENQLYESLLAGVTRQRAAILAALHRFNGVVQRHQHSVSQICAKCPVCIRLGGFPRRRQTQQKSTRLEKFMRCKQEDCNRRAHSRGWCTTHYRRWRAGEPRGAPIRRYVRHQEGANGNREAVTTKTVGRKPKKPFAAEYALLAELGLRSI
jgi:hypothetical protein